MSDFVSNELRQHLKQVEEIADRQYRELIFANNEHCDKLHDTIRELRAALVEALNEWEAWAISYDNKMAQGDSLVRILELRKLIR